MNSGYRSWKEREADVEKTRAEAAKLQAEAAQSAQAAEVGAAATETARLAEQVKQTRLRNQLTDVQERAADEKSKRKAKRRDERADDGTTFKTLVNTAMTLGLLAALPAQINYFLHLHRKDGSGQESHELSWMLSPIPFFLELLAWVGVAGTRWAHRKGLPRWPFWLLTIALASIAGYINLTHGTTEYGPVAGVALAATSVIGPILAEVRQFLETKAAEDGRTLQQRAKDRREAREKAKEQQQRKLVESAEDERRKKLFPAEFEEFERIMTAYPTGGITREAAWVQAWDTLHRLPLGMTAGTLACREAARAGIEAVLADAERSPESLAVDLFLQSVFPPNGGDDGPTGTPSHGVPEGPTGGGSRARREKARQTAGALGGKGKQPSRTTSDPDAERPLEEADLETVRKLASALGGPDRLSARNVREAVGCRTKYAIRLRDAVKAELPTND